MGFIKFVLILMLKFFSKINIIYELTFYQNGLSIYILKENVHVNKPNVTWATKIKSSNNEFTFNITNV